MIDLVQRLADELSRWRYSDTKLIAEARAAIAAPVVSWEERTNVELLIKQYEADDYDFSDIERVVNTSLRYTKTMPDSHVKCLLFVLANALSSRPSAPTQKVTDEMVARFLTWRLPDDFMPDCGVSFTKMNHPTSWPVGTNLLTATQARDMLEHVLTEARDAGGARTNVNTK